MSELGTGAKGFLSYSRKDAPLARRLETAIRARGREMWVDWSSIAPTAVWLEEIFAAIDSASAFVFAISPESVASQMCRLELDYACRAGKRLIPVLFRNTPSDKVPAELTRLQWIDCTSEDAIARCADSMIDAMDTDLAWVAFHTRLTVRAREWRADTQNTALLLRGVELVKAEQLLASSRDANPSPSVLQRQFLEASRWAARLRPVRSAGVLTIYALAMYVLVGMIENSRPYFRTTTAVAYVLGIEIVFAVVTFLSLRMPVISSFCFGLSVAAWHQALFYMRRAIWNPNGSFHLSLVGSLWGHDEDFIRSPWPFAFGSVIAWGLSIGLAWLGARRSIVLNPLNVATAWVTGILAASLALYLIPTLPESDQGASSLMLYTLLAEVTGLSVVGALLGWLPLAPSELQDEDAAARAKEHQLSHS